LAPFFLPRWRPVDEVAMVLQVLQLCKPRHANSGKADKLRYNPRLRPMQVGCDFKQLNQHLDQHTALFGRRLQGFGRPGALTSFNQL
jgi:hypothetical protein